MQVFDIGDAKAFLDAIERRYAAYRASQEKSTEELLFVVMGLNHLREWIAPEYDPGKPPTTKAEAFSLKIYQTPEHNSVREVCNGLKHPRQRSTTTNTVHEQDLFKWQNVFSVADVFKGPPVAHLIDGRPVEDFIDPLLSAYRSWF